MVCPTEEISLNETDKKFVRDQIQNALMSKGWTKAIRWLREWGLVGVVITAFLGIVAIAVTLGVFASNKIEQNATFRTHTEDRLTSIEASLLALRAQMASSQPLRKENQDAAKELLAEARKKSVPPIPELAVTKSGQAFVEAAENSPDAWDTALDFVNYQSSLTTPPPKWSGPRI